MSVRHDKWRSWEQPVAEAVGGGDKGRKGVAGGVRGEVMD